MPANLRINLLAGGVRPFLLGGPYAAFKLSCDVEDVPVAVDCEDDLKLEGSTGPVHTHFTLISSIRC